MPNSWTIVGQRGTREQPCLVSEHVTSRHLGAHGSDWRAKHLITMQVTDMKASMGVIKMQRLNHGLNNV